MRDTGQSAELEEIWSLFAQEGKENLAIVEDCLLALERDRANVEQIPVLFRGLHSFKGGARMMGLSVVETLAHRAEDLIALVRDDGVALQPEMIQVLLTVLDRLRALLDQVVKTGCDVEPAQADDLVARLMEMLAHAQAKNPGHAQAISLDEFLRLTPESLGRLHGDLDAFAAGETKALERIHAFAQEFGTAAEQLGYRRLAATAQDLAAESAAGASPTAGPAPEQLGRLQKLEWALFEELTRIQDAAASSGAATDTERTDIAWLFRHWNAEQVFTDLARLGELAEKIGHLSEADAPRAPAGDEREQARAAAARLRAIYHSCVFYRLDPATRLTLALEDLYARVAQGEWVANQALFHLTSAFVKNLGSAIEAIHEGETPNQDEWASLSAQAEDFTCLNTGEPGVSISRNILDVLNLPADFKEVMTPETLVRFQRALAAGEHFYTILADLEQDDENGILFYEWSQSQDLRIITSITVYRYDRTLFNFLIASPSNRESLVASLVKIDPDWTYLTLQECTPREKADRDDPREEQSAQTQEPQAAPGLQVNGGLSSEALGTVAETVGALVAEHATLHRVLSRLSTNDLTDQILRSVKTAQGDWTQARREIERLVDEWDNSLHLLGQVDVEMSTTLNQFQETVRTPLNMQVVDGMVVRVGDVQYVVPVHAIWRVVKPEADDFVHNSAEGDHTLLRFEGELVQICKLAGQRDGHYPLMVVVNGEQRRLALPIDELIGRQQVLVQPLQGSMAKVQAASGCALLGEGQVGMVLNMAAIRG